MLHNPKALNPTLHSHRRTVWYRSISSRVRVPGAEPPGVEPPPGEGVLGDLRPENSLDRRRVPLVLALLKESSCTRDRL